MASGDSRVWVKQDGVYVAGSIVVHDAGGNKSEVETAAGKLTVPRGEILQREPLTPGEGVDQLTDLSFLHAPAIVDNLSERFTGKNGEKVVYTYCGQICIAVNPYKWMRELYTVNVMNRYMGARFEDNQPHVYAVADAAYLAMMGKEGDTLKSQSILVSGESGAGKTESVKIMMEYIAQLGGRSGGDDEEGGHTSVAEAVIRANPLLEAFGNAKTLLNNNSSRFGKFTKILIDKNGMIAGSRVDVYLLEKSRVVRQAEGERNYHIFYQLLASTKLGAEKRAELDLTSPADYEYVNEVTVDGMDDEKEFDDMYEAMQVVGIPEEKQMQSFTAVAAAMAVGKIVLEAGIADGGDEKAVLSTSSPAVVKCAELLSVPADALGKALVSRQIHARGESYEIALTLAQAGDAKDALGKALYAKLFDWLVGVINVSTQPKDIKQCVATIGVLDIFGFESFAYNSLEQLLINFANEKLQQQFTWYVFKLEQAEYEKEGIKWDAVDFQDNQPVLDVLEGYGSVLALLQEECQLQKGTDLNFRTKLESAGKRFPKVNDPESGKPVESLSFNRRSQQTFTVRHYAGPVEYDVIGFTEKNKDTLGADIVGVMTSSGSEFVRDLFAQKLEKKAGRGPAKQQGLGGQFKTSLGALVDTINETGVHYVRCIKPNLNKSPEEFNVQGVNDQLRCQGILEAIRIARAAYPNRLPHYELTVRYQLCLRDKVLAKDYLAAGEIGSKFAAMDEIEAAHLLLDSLDVSDYQVGNTKVFFKREAMEAMEASRARVVDSFLTRLQATVRRMIYFKQYVRLKNSAVTVQKLARGKAARQHVREEKGARTVQAQWRGFSAQKEFRESKSAAVKIQNSYRRMDAIKQAQNRRIDANAALIQALIRRQPEYVAYQASKSAALVVQKNARTFNAQRAYVKKRDEARFKAQLENRLDEAEKIAKQSVSELDALKQQLEEERAARAAAESQVASLTAEVAAAKEGAGSAAATLEASLRAETAAAEEKAVGLAAQNTQLQEQLEAAQGQVAELGSEQKAANAAHDEQLQAAEAAHAEALQAANKKAENAAADAAAQAAAGAKAQASGASQEELAAATNALNEEKAKSSALEEENKALRGQVATVLSYLDQVMPMEGGGDAAAAAAAAQ